MFSVARSLARKVRAAIPGPITPASLDRYCDQQGIAIARLPLLRQPGYCLFQDDESTIVLRQGAPILIHAHELCHALIEDWRAGVYHEYPVDAAACQDPKEQAANLFAILLCEGEE